MNGNQLNNSEILQFLKELKPNSNKDKEIITKLIKEFEQRYKDEPDPYKQYEGDRSYW